MLGRLKTDILALGLFAATSLAALCVLTHDTGDSPGRMVFPPHDVVANWAGPVGATLSHHLITTCGVASWLVILAAFCLDLRLFTGRGYRDPLARGFGWLLLLIASCVSLRHIAPNLGGVSAHGSGGYIGAVGHHLLHIHFSTGGTVVLLGTAFVAGSMLVSEPLLFRVIALPILGPILVLRRLMFEREELAAEAVALTPPPLRIRDTEEDRFGTLTDDNSFENRGLTSNDDEQLINDELDTESSDHIGKTRTRRAALPDLPDAISDATTDNDLSSTIADEVSKESDEASDETEVRVNPPVVSTRSRDELHRTARDYDEDEAEYELPTLDLLEDSEEFPYEYLAEKARQAKSKLEKTFRDFDLNVKVVDIDTGPVITQFELQLEAGLRLSKVTALADDLAIALRVPSVRVVAPIPGKNTVGVEVPNDKRVMVRLRELIESGTESIQKMRIPMFLGKDVSGKPLVVDLAKMPHLLIAGRTGTGKSVCLNTLISSILMTRTADEVKMLMIDPKMVELSPYMRIPHLMHPVITDMKKAEAVLGWAVEKMEERYDLLARCGARHIDSYNELTRVEKLRRLGVDADTDEADQIPDNMPYIVIIADEMADMMMTSGKEVESHIIRLAQKSRAVGIHLVLATQKPTVDVITGLIKSNLPARISFQVASRVDSRVVLDEMGADKLLGNGDMLYLAPGTSKISRAQGTYISDGEVNRIIDFYSDFEPQYSQELAQLNTKASGKDGIEALRNRDELYEQAIDVVVREGRGSVSLLQRCLGIGYGRAARLVDYMAEDGIVGDYNGSQAREVLYSPEKWAELKGHSAEPAVA